MSLRVQAPSALEANFQILVSQSPEHIDGAELGEAIGLYILVSKNCTNFQISHFDVSFELEYRPCHFFFAAAAIFWGTTKCVERYFEAIQSNLSTSSCRFVAEFFQISY